MARMSKQMSRGREKETRHENSIKADTETNARLLQFDGVWMCCCYTALLPSNQQSLLPERQLQESSCCLLLAMMMLMLLVLVATGNQFTVAQNGVLVQLDRNMDENGTEGKREWANKPCRQEMKRRKKRKASGWEGGEQANIKTGSIKPLPKGEND